MFNVSTLQSLQYLYQTQVRSLPCPCVHDMLDAFEGLTYRTLDWLLIISPGKSSWCSIEIISIVIINALPSSSSSYIYDLKENRFLAVSQSVSDHLKKIAIYPDKE